LQRGAAALKEPQRKPKFCNGLRQVLSVLNYVEPLSKRPKRQARPDFAALGAAANLAAAFFETCRRVVRVKLPRPRAVGFVVASLLAAAAGATLPASAHHSLAPYDVEQSLHFSGVVESLRMENPHIALTLTVTKGDGTRSTVNFVEGVPAGRLERMGLKPSDIAVGKAIRAVGAPRYDDSSRYYLKAIILPDGRRFTFAD
jgi:hypothetical protein